jgi:hypothetical protein
VYYFQRWFAEEGEGELVKKCAVGSNLWIVFYNYALEDLCNYRPTPLNILKELRKLYKDEYSDTYLDFWAMPAPSEGIDFKPSLGT